MHHRNLIRAAARRGVAHIVALSGLDAALDSPFCYAVGYGYTEQLLAESGCAFSLARASIYTEFFLSFLTRARASGQLRLPAADGRVSFVSRGDVARSLAALATARPAARRRSPAPGPWTWPPSPPWPSRSGPPRSTYTAITPAELVADLAADGEDPWWIYAYSSMFASIRDHRWAAVSADTERLTGQPAHPGPHDPRPPLALPSPPGYPAFTVTPGVRTGSGSIDHVINGTGAAVTAASPGPSDVVSFP